MTVDELLSFMCIGLMGTYVYFDLNGFLVKVLIPLNKSFLSSLHSLSWVLWPLWDIFLFLLPVTHMFCIEAMEHESSVRPGPANIT